MTVPQHEIPAETASLQRLILDWIEMARVAGQSEEEIATQRWALEEAWAAGMIVRETIRGH